MGYDFFIEYKHGWDNKAADALSKTEHIKELCALSQSIPTLNEAIKKEVQIDLSSTTTSSAIMPTRGKGEAVPHTDGNLFFKHKIYLSEYSSFIPIIVNELHSATH